jgi:hypothetical protein
VGTHTAAYIAGISGVNPGGGALPVVVNANGQLGTGSGLGDITAVNTPGGGGLQGGATSGDVNLGLVTCGAGQVLKSDGTKWSCVEDADTGVNAVVNGGGVTGSIAARTLTLGSTATFANLGSTIVARDSSGNFSAGTITANLSGNATSATAFTGSLAGEVTGTQAATVVSNAVASNTANAIVRRDASGNFSAATISANLAGIAAMATWATNFSGSLAGEVTGFQAATVVSNAVSTNTVNAIVRRDGSGGFLAGTVGLAGNLDVANTTSASVGVLTKGGTRFLHNFGTGSTFVGSGAGNFTSTGEDNSGFGSSVLQVNMSGASNSGFGWNALRYNTTGQQNSAFGAEALQTNWEGVQNSAVGDKALFSNTAGSNNSAVGYRALYANTGYLNSAFGSEALRANTTGDANSAFGVLALAELSSGGGNTAVGPYAGSNLTSGNDNIYLGSWGGAEIESDTIRIGGDIQRATYIAGIYSATATARAVYVNSNGQLGTLSSSRRYKEQIADMSAESDVLLRLRPVSFYYRPELDETHLRQYGLVAEEVAEVAPGLVDYDKDGTPQTVRYHLVNAMLLNEVQKQRKQLEAQEAEIRELRAQQAQVQELREQLARLEARPAR